MRQHGIYRWQANNKHWLKQGSQSSIYHNVCPLYTSFIPYLNHSLVGYIKRPFKKTWEMMHPQPIIVWEEKSKKEVTFSRITGKITVSFSTYLRGNNIVTSLLVNKVHVQEISINTSTIRLRKDNPIHSEITQMQSFSTSICELSQTL